MDKLIERDGSSWGLRQINERKTGSSWKEREKKIDFNYRMEWECIDSWKTFFSENNCKKNIAWDFGNQNLRFFSRDTRLKVHVHSIPLKNAFNTSCI